MANMNQTTAAMTGNISSIGNAPKRMHADTASPSNAKRQKASDEASGDESADSVDSSAFSPWARTTKFPISYHSWGQRRSYIFRNLVHSTLSLCMIATLTM